MISCLEQILDADQLKPDDAATVAGKLYFLTTSIFGHAAKAALRPIYARGQWAPRNKQQAEAKLNHGLRTTIRVVLDIIRECRPVQIPLSPTTTFTPVVYADAYFLMGDLHLKPTDEIPDTWDTKQAPHFANGWGFVCRARPDLVLYACGAASPRLLRRFCKRRAFIYFLEAWAQIIAAIAFKNYLRTDYVAFIDNEAAKHALQKGYGKDECINNLLAAFWTYTTKHNIQPHFERVSSQANISDEISRGDLARAHREGWKRIEFDYHLLENITEKIATNTELAFDKNLFEPLFEGSDPLWNTSA